MRLHRSLAAVAAVALLAPAGLSQDSVALLPCLGGDATSPWDDALAVNGSEQCNDFVVDLNAFTTCWGTEFGIAPLLKTSKTSAGFTGSLMSAQAISQTQKTIAGAAGTYDAWTGPGFGVNNNPAINDAGTPISAPCDMQQFGVAFAEFATTDLLQSYGGVIGARVAFQPSNPGRLYVNKTVAAINSENPASNYASLAIGSVNADGEVFIRGDGFGATGGALSILPGNNIYSIDLAGRDCDALNVISDDSPGLKDVGALSHYVVNDLVTAHGPPNNVGLAAVDTYVGGNFNGEAVSGPAGSVTTSTAHLAAATDARGNVSYCPQNFGLLGSTHGLAGILGNPGASDQLNVWGLDGTGSPTGALACSLPGSITDNDDGFTTLGPAGTLEFDHYHSQVAFQGGNGQVAMRVLDSGDLIVAGVLDHPLDGGTDYPINAIGVCKVDGVTGAETWTLAAWNDGVSGKVIKDGPGGLQKGTLVPLNQVTGGTPLGPSMSAPMIDSKGNIWFTSALFTDDDQDFATGLVRAMFNEASFSYELDLVMKTGNVFKGENSTLDYLVTFMGIADGNSVSSGAAWSNNMSAQAHGAMDPSTISGSDPRANGGVVISASIIYDTNGDGDFTDCGLGGVDEDYNVLLYIGHCGWDDVGGSKAAASGITPSMQIKGIQVAGSPGAVTLSNMAPGETFFVLIGFSGVFLPFKGGTLVPSADVIFPGIPTGGGNFVLPFVWPAAIPPCVPLWYQTWVSGPGITGLFSATNGIFSVTP